MNSIFDTFNSTLRAAASGLPDAPVGSQTIVSQGRPAPREPDLRRTRDPQGRPVVEMAPSSQTPVRPQDDEILSILHGDIDARAKEFDAQFQSQEQMVRGHFQDLLKNMEGEYQIERRYLEETPMDREQREEQVRRLNLKYEKQIYKLKSEAQGPLSELQQQRSATLAELEAKRSDALRRVQVVRDLAKSGRIQDEGAAIQEQLQAVGISLPMAAFQPPKEITPQDQLKAIRSELEFVTAATSPFVPAKEGGEMFNKDGTLKKDVLFVESSGSKGRRLTEAEREEANALFAHQRYLQSARNQVLGQLQAGRLSRAMETAGNTQSTPFADKIAEQVQKQAPKPTTVAKSALKGKPTLALVNQLKAQGLSRVQAEQWLKENGYDVGS